MNQASCDAYSHGFKPNGLLLVDSGLVEQVPTSRVVALPFTKIAREEADKNMVANIVALGALVYLCPILSINSLEAAMAVRVPKGTEEMNTRALQAGINAARKFDLDSLPRSIIPDEEEEI
ncbi:2-oxoacid:acceptor oxidoreductase family protein, partial [Thermodesulfobacteriota bacterium]